jgi:hypothetical protein
LQSPLYAAYLAETRRKFSKDELSTLAIKRDSNTTAELQLKRTTNGVATKNQI